MHPQQVGPYQIVSRLGHGGMGAVYEAVEPRSGKAVAIKVLAAHLTDDPGVRSRFETEIATLKSLQHPGVVQLLAYGEDDGQPYFAMELVRGQALDKLLRNGRRFTWRETVAVASAVARALKLAHDSGVIHRDLKPANLLVPDNGTLAAIKLADFGIAKFFGAAGHTAAGNVVGTAEYMAPEQAAGKPVDARADIYSLGLVMFAMLTGKPPFRAGHYTEVMRMQQSMSPPRLTTVLPDLPEPLDQLIQRMLAKNPAERPASVLALGRLLDSIEGTITMEAAAAKPLVIDTSSRAGLTARVISPQDATLDVTTSQPAVSSDARLMAPTQGATTPPQPAHPTKRDGGTKQSTDIDVMNTHVAPIRRSHHVSVEREKVIAAAREKRAHHRELWMQTTSVAGLTAVLLAGGYLVLRPLTADALRSRIDETVAAATERLDGLKNAEREIDEFLRRFAGGPGAEEVAALKQRILVDRLEKRSALRKRRNKPPYLRIERDYREALESDDPHEQLTRLKAILDAQPKTLTTPVGLPAADDDLQGNLELWRALITVKIDQVRQLASADQRAKQLDAPRGKP